MKVDAMTYVVKNLTDNVEDTRTYKTWGGVQRRIGSLSTSYPEKNWVVLRNGIRMVQRDDVVIVEIGGVDTMLWVDRSESFGWTGYGERTETAHNPMLFRIYRFGHDEPVLFVTLPQRGELWCNINTGSIADIDHTSGGSVSFAYRGTDARPFPMSVLVFMANHRMVEPESCAHCGANVPILVDNVADMCDDPDAIIVCERCDAIRNNTLGVSFQPGHVVTCSNCGNGIMDDDHGICGRCRTLQCIDAGLEHTPGQRYVIGADDNAWVRDAFITYLESTLIPDLIESGSDTTADDFKTAVMFMRDDDRKPADHGDRVDNTEYVPREYFVVLTRESTSHPWTIHNGFFDRMDAGDEKQDLIDGGYAHRNVRVITTTDMQHDIDERVAELNRGGK